MVVDDAQRSVAVEALKRVISELREAVNTGDAARVYQITAEDFEIMPPGQKALSGTPAREFLSGMVKHFNAELKPFANEEIVVAGEWAFQRYTYDLTLTPQDAG